MMLYPLTNFAIQKNYQNESGFYGVFSKTHLPKMKDEAYVINLMYISVGTH